MLVDVQATIVVVLSQRSVALARSKPQLDVPVAWIGGTPASPDVEVSVTVC